MRYNYQELTRLIPIGGERLKRNEIQLSRTDPFTFTITFIYYQELTRLFTRLFTFTFTRLRNYQELTRLQRTDPFTQLSRTDPFTFTFAFTFRLRLRLLELTRLRLLVYSPAR